MNRSLPLLRGLGGVFGGVVAAGAAGDDGVEFALDELTAYH